jgi:pimeloyl-ACP methyl ester carboxylesterase
MVDLEAWFSGGQRVRLAASNGQPVELFCRLSGAGPNVTLVHGFPTCSWDWAAISDNLSSDHQLLMPDLLGFGDSDKPPGHHYSLVEQADLLEALWQHLGIRETALVAHDIGATVAQELLARQSEGRLPIRLTHVILLNSALYEAVSRPRPVQKLLSQPLVGPILARLMTERLFSRNLTSVFSVSHPLSGATAHNYWVAFRRRSTSPHIHRLLQYIPERHKHHARWESVLERASVPLHFIWGMADPVSGAPVAEHIRSHVPSAQLVALDAVGHYPHVEVPDRVLAELRTLL